MQQAVCFGIADNFFLHGIEVQRARAQLATTTTKLTEHTLMPLTRRDATLSPSDGERDGVRGFREFRKHTLFGGSVRLRPVVAPLLRGTRVTRPSDLTAMPTADRGLTRIAKQSEKEIL